MSAQSAFCTFSGIVALGLTLSNCSSLPLEQTATEQDAGPVPFQKIVEFDRAVHLMTPEGKDTVLPQGTYRIETAQEGLRLTSAEKEGTDAVVIQAEATTHDLPVKSPEPIVMKEGDDNLVVLLLLPDGKARQAVGSYTGIISRHAVPIIKPGAIAGLAGQLPKINSLLATPPPPAYDPPPPGHVAPLGTLYLKGEQFGSSRGKVMLHVQVPVDKHFYAAAGTESFPGNTPGTRKVQLEVTQWSPDKIVAKMPLISGVPDHSAVLQILNAQGLGSAGWNVPFYAMRARMTLKFGENVTDFQCAIGGNPTDISGCLNQTLQGSPGKPCFHSARVNREKTISGWHVNCDLIADWDKGSDRYTIELRNRWIIEEIRWGWNPHSTSEKLNLPSPQALTQKYKGASTITLWVPFEVSPGPDWLDYWIDVDVKGPAGILYGDRVYWKQ